MNLSFRTK